MLKKRNQGLQVKTGLDQRLKRHKSRVSKRSLTLMSEINVTPFVDVMLVLLIIFMITAPMLTVGY